MTTDDVPASNKIWLLDIAWNRLPTQHAHYARWSNDLTVSGTNYTSEMRIAITPGQEVGGPSDKPWIILIPSLPPFDLMIRPYDFPDCYITIRECDPLASGGPTSRIMFGGRVSKTTRNKSGNKGLIAIEVSGPRSLLQYPVGLQCNPLCPWILADLNCKKNITSMSSVRTVTAITAGTTVHFGTALVAPGTDWQFYFYGEMRLRGLGIMILGSDHGGVKFYLADPPPPEWIGENVTVFPGCDHQPQTCEDRFTNIGNYGGSGYAIPYYHPVIGPGHV